MTILSVESNQKSFCSYPCLSVCICGLKKMG